MADDEVFDDDQDDEVLAGAPGTSGRSKLVTILIWVAVGIISVVLMVLVAYIMAKKVRTDAYKEDQNIVIAPPPEPLTPFTFPEEFRVNTADTDEPHFIQLKLALGYEGENVKLQTELINRQSQMKHIINIILGGKKKEDLATPLQKLNLAEEIKSQLNMILSSGKVQEVFFLELVVS